MTVSLGQEDSEIRIGELEIDGFVGDLQYRIVPPGDALLPVEHVGNALIERILEQSTLSVSCSLICRPTCKCNNCEQKQTKERNYRPNNFRQPAEIAFIQAGCISQQH